MTGTDVGLKAIISVIVWRGWCSSRRQQYEMRQSQLQTLTFRPKSNKTSAKDLEVIAHECTSLPAKGRAEFNTKG